MTKKTYTVASEAGAQWANAPEGEAVELDLDPRTEQAVVAAGWIEPETTKKKAKEG